MNRIDPSVVVSQLPRHTNDISFKLTFIDENYIKRKNFSGRV